MRHYRAAAALLATCLLATPAGAQQGTEDGEWRSYSGDVWGTKYAPLDQITGDNFNELELAWRWRSADTHLPYETALGLSLVPACSTTECGVPKCRGCRFPDAARRVD